jgi:RNA polymerase sigma-70 factor (ECF subfamily)
VYGFSRKSGLSHEEAEEVTNDVFVRVSKTIHEFESRPEKGSFRGWLMNLTRWRVNDKFRGRRRDEGARRGPSASEGTSTMDRIPDPGQVEDLWEKEWQATVVDAAMDRIAKRTSAKHFQVFELYARQRWPVVRISRELGLNPAGVYLINHRMTKLLKSEILHLGERLK